MNRKGILLLLILSFCMNNVLAAASQVLLATVDTVHDAMVSQALEHTSQGDHSEMPMANKGHCQSQSHECDMAGECGNCYLHCTIALPQSMVESLQTLQLSSELVIDLSNPLLSRIETLYRPPILS